jgi:uncharacterized protein
LFAVDTNVLVYAANRDLTEHRPCRQLLEDWRYGSETWCTTWSVLYEFLRVVTHPRVFSHPWSLTDAWSFVAAVLDSPSHRVLLPTSRHEDLAALTVEEFPELRGNVLHDAHIAVLMREHGVERLYTRDTDFRRFPFLTVLDPLNVET